MSGNIADRLGLSKEVREFKLGKSFSERAGNAFHSVRYDFKPASVDTSKMAAVDIGESNQVTVTVPHVEGTAQTVFRGSRRPYQKECVLIIDHNTGEITLEKLSTNIQLKKTRAEGSSRALLGRPITPIDNPVGSSNNSQHSSNSKKPSPNNSHSQQLRYSPKNNHSPGSSNQRSWTSPQTSPSIEMPNSASPSMPNILANVQSSSSRSSNGYKSNSASRNNGNSYNSSQSMPPSMPQLLGQDNTLIVENTEVMESGDLSNSSGSDSSSSSDEDDDNDDQPKVRQPQDELEALLLSGDPEPMDTGSAKNDTHSSSGSSSSSSSDSEDSDDVPTPSKKKATSEIKKSGMSSPDAKSTLSMPKLSQLSQDLQLSESGSDSDD